MMIGLGAFEETVRSVMIDLLPAVFFRTIGRLRDGNRGEKKTRTGRGNP